MEMVQIGDSVTTAGQAIVGDSEGGLNNGMCKSGVTNSEAAAIEVAGNDH